MLTEGYNVHIMKYYPVDKLIYKRKIFSEGFSLALCPTEIDLLSTK